MSSWMPAIMGEPFLTVDSLEKDVRYQFYRLKLLKSGGHDGCSL